MPCDCEVFTFPYFVKFPVLGPHPTFPPTWVKFGMDKSTGRLLHAKFHPIGATYSLAHSPSHSHLYLQSMRYPAGILLVIHRSNYTRRPSLIAPSFIALPRSFYDVIRRPVITKRKWNWSKLLTHQ